MLALLLLAAVVYFGGRALLLIVVLQNSQHVEFKVLFLVDTSAPLVLLLLLAAVIGAVIGYTAPILRRHRHKTRQEYGKE